jgi:hypothetical protein
MDLPQPATLVASDGSPNDFFGTNVALSGDTAIVTANNDDPNGDRSGSAYVFRREGDRWTQETKLIPNDGDPRDWFGRSLALTGETALIGADADKNQSPDLYHEGSVYVFQRQDGEWIQQAKLKPDEGPPADVLGRSIDFDGETALIGAVGGAEGDLAGAAYVFTVEDGEWTKQSKFIPEDSHPSDYFGQYVTLAGDTAFITAPRDENPDGTSGLGAVYVFQRDGEEWIEEAKLVPNERNEGDGFGIPTAVTGDTVFIGAPNHQNAGAAYVFRRDAQEWRQSQKFSIDGTVTDDQDRFGAGIAVSDDLALIGAPGNENSPDRPGFNSPEENSHSGTVYLYRRENGEWTQQKKIVPSHGDPENFGTPISLAGNTALMGSVDTSSQVDDEAMSMAFIFEQIS